MFVEAWEDKEYRSYKMSLEIFSISKKISPYSNLIRQFLLKKKKPNKKYKPQSPTNKYNKLRVEVGKISNPLSVPYPKRFYCHDTYSWKTFTEFFINTPFPFNKIFQQMLEKNSAVCFKLSGCILNSCTWKIFFYFPAIL